METMENNIPSATHQEKAKKMKKLRRWQIAVSLLGVAIIVWGVIEVICLFLNYSQTETSNDAQIEQYVSPSTCVHPAILTKSILPSIRRYVREIRYWYLTIVNIRFG